MKKKGISLIVLVITIIVIIILATAVILTMVKNNPIENAKVAVLKSDAKTFAEELNLNLAGIKVGEKSFRPEEVEAYSLDDIQNYITSFDPKYEGKLCIHEGKVKYIGTKVTAGEEKALTEIGIEKTSYITREEIEEIKNTFDESGALPTELPKEIKDKFAVVSNHLYYRWEKTSYPEKVAFNNAGISYFLGDVTGDGRIAPDDTALIDNVVDEPSTIKNLKPATLPRPPYTKDSRNVVFVGDMDYNGKLEENDVNLIFNHTSATDDIFNHIDLEKQNPERVCFLGAYIKTTAVTPNGNITDPGEIMRIDPVITYSEAKRFTVINGTFAYRYEMLSDNEIAWLYEHEIPFNLGDVNFDGKIDEEDKNKISRYIQGYKSELQGKQLIVADISGDGIINTADKSLVGILAAFPQRYLEFMNDYFATKKAS